ncbi:hypothetical protein EGT07_18155 [Herbaspirillum sp. HC18]|nr:hypothetical protein EGT07_18155 [Herbaspirillum sp. HC18]
MDAIEALCEAKIRAAEDGDVDASRWLIQNFINTVRANRDKNGRPYVSPSGIHTQFYESLLDYFANHFEQIIEGGVPADKALGLNKGATGRVKRTNKHERDTHIILAVLAQMKENPSITKDEAKTRAARKLKEGKATVDKAWNNKPAKLNAELIIRMSDGD